MDSGSESGMTNMSYQFLPHTADVKLYVEEKKLADLCVDAAVGLFDFLTPDDFTSNERSKDYEINVESFDESSLVVDLLSDLLCLAQTEKVILGDFAVCDSSNNKISIKAKGYKVDDFRDDIKGVTYHGAKVEKLENGNLCITITFDI